MFARIVIPPSLEPAALAAKAEAHAQLLLHAFLAFRVLHGGF